MCLHAHAPLGGVAAPSAADVYAACVSSAPTLAAIFGNVITAWSFFGTNMLGIGLHSYGFMDKAFAWLMVFVCSQIVIMTGGLMLGTLDNAGKVASHKDGAAAASPLPWLIVEGGVIVITAAGTIIYLLKAFGF